MLRRSLRKRADETACASQALYSSPSAGQVVDSSVNTIFKWDRTCLPAGTDKIDIYLYAPTSAKANLPIHAWTDVPATKGDDGYSVKLFPKWWNVTTTLTQQTALSLNIVKSGNEPWDSSNPFGPTWEVSRARRLQCNLKCDAHCIFTLLRRLSTRRLLLVRALRQTPSKAVTHRRSSLRPSTTMVA